MVMTSSAATGIGTEILDTNEDPPALETKFVVGSVVALKAYGQDEYSNVPRMTVINVNPQNGNIECMWYDLHMTRPGYQTETFVADVLKIVK